MTTRDHGSGRSGSGTGTGSRARRRLPRLKIALAAAVSFAVAGTAAQVMAAQPDETGKQPAVPSLAWSDCQDGFECANADVPLDYRDPQGKTITLTVIRKKAPDQAKKKGTLFLQPGGPGNSGVDFVRGNYAELPAALRDSFDVFGYDVRGVGRSSQVQCWDDPTYTRAITAAKGVPGPDAYEPAVRQAAEFDQACQDNAGDLLPYVGTEYVARDIDLLRQALGENQLTYYGRSFGSYIGTVYAALFPDRVRALALDGAYDPEHYANQPYAYDRPQYLALDGAMSRFLDWCEADQATCGFGDGDPRAAFEKLKADLDANPVPTANGGQANGYTLVYRILFNINEGKVIWPSLGEALRKAQQRGHHLVPAAAAVRRQLRLPQPERGRRVHRQAYPRDPALLKRQVTANAKLAPLLGPALAYGPPLYDHQHATACVQWKGEQVSRYDGSFRAKGSAADPRRRQHRRPGHPVPGRCGPVPGAGQRPAAHLQGRRATAFGRSALCATDARHELPGGPEGPGARHDLRGRDPAAVRHAEDGPARPRPSVNSATASNERLDRLGVLR
ncbi:hypothetical protein GCM10011428_71420 [Streptomyces violaceus]